MKNNPLDANFDANLTPKINDIKSKKCRKNAEKKRDVLSLHGAEGRTRTGTESPPRDFKSLVSTIPPLRQILSVDSTTREEKGTSENLGGTTQIRTGGEGFADLCLTTWLWCHKVSLMVGTVGLEPTTPCL